jgi:hypothetical protein
VRPVFALLLLGACSASTSKPETAPVEPAAPPAAPRALTYGQLTGHGGDQELPDFSSGIPACDDYQAARLRSATCDTLTEESRKALSDSFDRSAKGWKDMDREAVDRATPETRQAFADACRKSTAELTEALTRVGC